MDFVVHPKFGHLTFCPTNIGTGLRASVHVKGRLFYIII
jgi:protein-arginine kinase